MRIRFVQKVHLACCWLLIHYQNNYNSKNRSLFYWPLPRRAVRSAVLGTARHIACRGPHTTLLLPCAWREQTRLLRRTALQSTWLGHCIHCVGTASVHSFSVRRHQPNSLVNTLRTSIITSIIIKGLELLTTTYFSKYEQCPLPVKQPNLTWLLTNWNACWLINYFVSAIWDQYLAVAYLPYNKLEV